MLLPSIFGEDLFDEWMLSPFEREFEKGFGGNRSPLFGKRARNLMKTDVKEVDGSYEVDVDLPGFKKEDLKLALEDGYLTITASKGLDKDHQDEKGTYIRRERYSGTLSRSFYVGDGVAEAEIRARFEDGILKLTVPKKEQKKLENKNYIQIEG